MLPLGIELGLPAWVTITMEPSKADTTMFHKALIEGKITVGEKSANQEKCSAKIDGQTARLPETSR
jgi:hypothetical protein